MTLADIIIPLCGSISNERAQKIREACDMQERRVEALEKRVEALSLDVAILVEGTVEAVHEAGLRTLAQRVEALEQIRISHEADYSKSASVLADRIEALDRALSAAAEDNGDLDVRVPALERASAKNTGEGHGVAGSTPAGPSRSTTMPSTASPAGNVPSWVPSADEIQQFIDDGREGDLRSLIASRAPRPSPQPSVEELARKIAARIYGDDGQYVEPQHHAWQAAEVALAALSAMPASEELTDAEAQRLYDDAAKDAKPFGDHEVERFVRVTVDPQAEVLALQKQRNDVYEERDRLVAALSKCFPSWLARHPDTDKAWDDDWRWIVFVQLPTGQATWHIHDRELAWFDHLEVRENSWDGHTTEEKYRRLERLPAREAQGEPTLEECETAYDEAWRNADIGSLSVDDIKNPGVAAVRSLCLAHRAPSPSPALAAIVEAGDAMRNYFDETTLTMNRVKDKDAPGLMWALTEEYVSGATPILTDWDRARAALPKGGAA